MNFIYEKPCYRNSDTDIHTHTYINIHTYIHTYTTHNVQNESVFSIHSYFHHHHRHRHNPHHFLLFLFLSFPFFFTSQIGEICKKKNFCFSFNPPRTIYLHRQKRKGNEKRGGEKKLFRFNSFVRSFVYLNGAQCTHHCIWLHQLLQLFQWSSRYTINEETQRSNDTTVLLMVAKNRDRFENKKKRKRKNKRRKKNKGKKGNRKRWKAIPPPPDNVSHYISCHYTKMKKPRNMLRRRLVLISSNQPDTVYRVIV